VTLRAEAPDVIATERLVLRRPEASDWTPWVRFMGSERARWVGGPADAELAWRSLATIIGHWTLRGFGSFVFALRDTGEPIGLTGPWYPHGWPERELGWTVWTAEAEGQGFAFEAASAARDHAFRALGWTAAVSYIHPRNARSIALARRLGATEDRYARRRDADDLVFRHPVPEAAA
jgi:RimJ/RimL family protein N-acetyltransferase